MKEQLEIAYPAETLYLRTVAKSLKQLRATFAKRYLLVHKSVSHADNITLTNNNESMNRALGSTEHI